MPHTIPLRDYGHHLEAHPEEVLEPVRAFLLKVTGFFRDPEAFEYVAGARHRLDFTVELS